MKEKILYFKKSNINGKKYSAFVQDKKTKKIRKLDFGALDYQQYKDRTPCGLYTYKNHSTRTRQQNYYNRHSGTKNRKQAISLEKKKSKGYYTSKILSHLYLW
tara:strand:+ start:3923 stop:4231 length:309 start_codon:yes stop_codon:yes gene_type:complete